MSNGKAHDFDRTDLIELRTDSERIRIRFVCVREHTRFWTRNWTTNGRRNDDSRTTFATKEAFDRRRRKRNEYANDASQDRNTRNEKPIDKKNVTKRQYSVEEHGRSTKQNNESRWIEFKRRNTVHCSEKELSKCDQETCNNKVISNGHNKRPRVLTRKLNLNLKHDPYWMCWTLNLKKSHRHSEACSTARVC